MAAARVGATRSWILLLVPGAIWGASFLFIAEGLEVMGPNGVTFTRILAYVLTVMAAGRVGATKASATAFLIPPVAVLLGVLVRGEHVATLSVVGGVVCLVGAWLMRRAQLEHAGQAPAQALQAAAYSGADEPASATGPVAGGHGSR
jgi:drug/metabolite transporter (DMT)-like permease